VLLVLLLLPLLIRCDKQGKRLVLALAFFGQLQHLVAGSVLAAIGVVVMHYLGMAAMYVSVHLRLLTVQLCMHDFIYTPAWQASRCACSATVANVYTQSLTGALHLDHKC
jgi:NO-binding membrane sensor protein with MHYT domain